MKNTWAETRVKVGESTVSKWDIYSEKPMAQQYKSLLPAVKS